MVQRTPVLDTALTSVRPPVVIRSKPAPALWDQASCWEQPAGHVAGRLQSAYRTRRRSGPSPVSVVRTARSALRAVGPAGQPVARAEAARQQRKRRTGSSDPTSAPSVQPGKRLPVEGRGLTGSLKQRKVVRRVRARRSRVFSRHLAARWALSTGIVVANWAPHRCRRHR